MPPALAGRENDDQTAAPRRVPAFAFAVVPGLRERLFFIGRATLPLDRCAVRARAAG